MLKKKLHVVYAMAPGETVYGANTRAPRRNRATTTPNLWFYAASYQSPIDADCQQQQQQQRQQQHQQKQQQRQKAR